MFFMATDCQPLLAEDRPAGTRSWDARLGTLVSVATAGDPVATALVPLFLGLMRQEPERRWDLERARAFLDGLAAVPLPPAARAGTPDGYRLGTAEQDRLLGDGLAHILRTISPAAVADPEARAALWPVKGANGYGATTDPCAVQYGTAGVLTLLASLAGHEPATASARPARTEPPGPHAGLPAGLRDAAGWTARRLAGEHRPSPGLYFGRAGIAWGLHEAGRALGDDALRAAGAGLALDLPTNWPNPDVCHGLAGTGLALLHFWYATGDARFRERAGECADALLKAARRTPGRCCGPFRRTSTPGWRAWCTTASPTASPGSAPSCWPRAPLWGARTAWRRPWRPGRPCWPRPTARATPSGGRAPRREDRLPHWCSGSSGVGTFLIRLYATTGDRRLLDAARGAAVAVHAHRLSSGTAACHGLAGDGQFLLDMAGVLGEPVYHELAEELAGCLWARAVVRDGLLVVPDESTTEVTVGWNTGLAGVLDFLHRLRHGGPRPWMADPPGDGPPDPAAAGAARRART
nr:hypothetical protein GCM10020093_032250 [Planobispora longispora]